MICPRCKGEKTLKYEVNLHENNNPVNIECYKDCVKCNGTGRLDWIEAIVGKKDIVIDFENKIVNINRSYVGELKLYNHLKDEFSKSENMSHSFPMCAVTPKQFGMINGWRLENVIPEMKLTKNKGEIK